MKNDKIFVALNDYETPNPIVNYGVQLAKKLDRPAYLFGVEKVPVLNDPISITGSELPNPALLDIEAIKKIAKNKVRILRQEASLIHPHIQFDVEIGFPEETIIDKTDEEKPYLVVLEGNNNLTTLHEWFGTYETRMAENIDAPVLVLPKKNKWKSVSRIVYIMDLNDHTVENMRFLTTVAEELNAEIAVVLLSIEKNEAEIDKYNQIIKTMKILLNYTNVNFHQIFTQDTAETIEKLMKKVDADWLAFEHDSKSFLERMLDNYNTKRLILQSEIPVLVF